MVNTHGFLVAKINQGMDVSGLWIEPYLHRQIIQQKDFVVERRITPARSILRIEKPDTRGVMGKSAFDIPVHLRSARNRDPE